MEDEWLRLSSLHSQTTYTKKVCAKPSKARVNAALTNFKNMGVLVCAGISEEGYEKSAEFYAVASESWVNAPKMIVARISVSSCALGDKVYVFGG